MEVLILIPEAIYKTCTFYGDGVSGAVLVHCTSPHRDLFS